ncbi:aldehyde dehydrogenase family protein [Streptomyces flaveus]|uniref:aldehyde dehydrogenase family protein n=1 Tax=Streptomyces flaveus TaxID=66370 RepID=UPI00332950D3
MTACPPSRGRPVFGPVAAIHRFSTEAEAIAVANNTEHGLASYLMTSEGRRRRPGSRSSSGGWSDSCWARAHAVRGRASPPRRGGPAAC